MKSGWYGWALAAIVLILVLPFWIYEWIGITDLPLHMARAYAYHFFDSDPVFDSYLSRLHLWRHNAAAELAIGPLLGWLSLQRATQLVLTLYVFVFAAGCHWLGRGIQGGGNGFGPPHPAALLCLFFSYNSMFLYGYVSSSMGLACALLALGLCAGWMGRWNWPRAIALSALATVTYIFHLSAFGILGFCWGVWTLWKWLSGKRVQAWDIGVFTAFAPGAVLYLTAGRELAGHQAVAWSTAVKKGISLLTGFTTYTAPLGLAAAAVCLGGLACGLFLFRRSLWRAPMVVGAALGALFLIMPVEYHGANDVDTRLAPAVLILLALAIPAAPGRAGAVLMGLAMAAFAVRQIDIAGYLRQASGDIARELASLEKIERHALLYSFVWLDENPAVNKRSRHYLHLPALAIARRHVRYANLALIPAGTYALQARRDFQFGPYVNPGGSFQVLDWSRFRSGPVYFWTYGLTPAAMEELKSKTVIVHEAGPVRVFRVVEEKIQA